MITTIEKEGKTYIIVGTAHVSQKSVEEVEKTIAEYQPDTVCIELCPSRHQSITQKDQWQNTNIFKIIKEKKAFVLLANLLLGAFQRKMAEKFDVRPGQEMLTAMEAAKASGAELVLADRDIRTTLSRAWRAMGFWNKLKMLAQLIVSFGDTDDISAEEIEKMKNADVLESLLAEIGASHPDLKRILIDERDLYLAHKIKTAPGKTIVAVVGAGHVPGMKNCWDQEIDIAPLAEQPQPRPLSKIIKWAIPLLVIGIFVAGFFYGGRAAGQNMITYWLLANGILAGIGAICALAHPLTSLNPMIAAGWVSGLVEAVLRKPKVRDVERLQEDLNSLKGFWQNHITRILLVVVFTNIGSMIGTFVAIPLMMRYI